MEHEDERKETKHNLGKIDEKHNFYFLIEDTDIDDEKHFMKWKERKKQIKTKLKYCRIILEDKELSEILFYF